VCRDKKTKKQKNTTQTKQKKQKKQKKRENLFFSLFLVNFLAPKC
jgi:hypothetical protein